MKTPESFIRIKNDVNGNPRYVTSWCGMGFKSYEEALKSMKTVGGKKFNHKQFGGGIVFQSYSLIETCNHINSISID